MFLRIIRIRIKSEWLALICLFLLVILYIWFCGLDIRSMPLGSYKLFEEKYSEVLKDGYTDHAAEIIANSLALDKPIEGASLRELYAAALTAQSGFSYSRLLMGAEKCSLLLMGALAMLFLCPFFTNRRVGQFLAAGYSRGQVFLSLTATYFACAVLMWLIASTYLLNRYHIDFSSEDRGFFITTQLAWLCNILFNAALAYLAAFLLQKPIPTFFVALGVWILLLIPRIRSQDPSIIPVSLMGSGDLIKTWEPGMDTSTLVAGNWITLGFLIVAVAAAWLNFRKRGIK